MSFSAPASEPWSSRHALIDGFSRLALVSQAPRPPMFGLRASVECLPAWVCLMFSSCSAQGYGFGERRRGSRISSWLTGLSTVKLLFFPFLTLFFGRHCSVQLTFKCGRKGLTFILSVWISTCSRTFVEKVVLSPSELSWHPRQNSVDHVWISLSLDSPSYFINWLHVCAPTPATLSWLLYIHRKSWNQQTQVLWFLSSLSKMFYLLQVPFIFK